ncbi:hypothetical protein JTE90_008257 [Oedothorax gibbosus]|uniref:Glucose-methanol-choline oxidoreductase N-terminal domain-containing protein n=1 Tax=Oedothorax gibbosus TaxID=931172 RepID=A0AAV6TFC8_9ARAC|nr:hypothetical protein JTE90_008257 [Oedothorax gibbosus]
MGNPNDPNTVVDPELRVKNVKGLRVVDASVMPLIPWGNTFTSTMMVAEKGSDIIKKSIECDKIVPLVSRDDPNSPNFPDNVHANFIFEFANTMDLARNNAYDSPVQNNPVLPLLLAILASQRNSPKVSESLRHKEYDYIIVGAGSAGSVVASRLSEILCVNVLLLEAGPTPPLLNDVPVLSRNFWGTDIDWNYRTVSQKHSGFGLVNRQVVWPSGKGLGGSSLLNAMIYVRGNTKNYDDWAAHGAVGWSWSDVKPYFLKLDDNTDQEYISDGFYDETVNAAVLPKDIWSQQKTERIRIY